MRPIALALCLLTAACNGRGPDTLTSPSAAVAHASPAVSEALPIQARRVIDLPFHGEYTLQTEACTTCPPPILVISGTEEGNATHLGRFTATSEDFVNIVSTESTGTFNLTAADGDRMFTTTVGKETRFQPPNVSFVTQTATIVGGTGRFAGATGSFTVEFVQTIAPPTATGTGSFAGRITINK